jgi:hypothetical protein
MSPVPCRRACATRSISDPSEHHDLALSQPALAQSILDRMHQVQPSWYNPDRGNPDPRACEVAESTGFWAPFLDDTGEDIITVDGEDDDAATTRDDANGASGTSGAAAAAAAAATAALAAPAAPAPAAPAAKVNLTGAL